MPGERPHNPFEDEPRAMTSHHDPFEDANGSPELFVSDAVPYTHAGPSSREAKHGYALDPFFDE